MPRRPKISLTRSIWLVVAILVLAACGGGGSSPDAAGDADADGEGTAIEGPEATAEPTATATATATPEPTTAPTATAEPTATPGPEAEIIEAWERYLRLSIEARGKDPSPEALDFDSYVVGGARDGLVQEMADDKASGRYVTGSIAGSPESVELREDGAAILSLCLVTDLASFSLDNDELIAAEGELMLNSRARLDPLAEGWRVAATEFGPDGCG